MIVYLARDIQAFVMYCVNGTSSSSLLIESTDFMIQGNESLCFIHLAMQITLDVHGRLTYKGVWPN